MFFLCYASVRMLQLYWFWRQNIIMNIGTKQEHIVHRTMNVYISFYSFLYVHVYILIAMK